jgi:hypothetical protein
MRRILYTSFHSLNLFLTILIIIITSPELISSNGKITGRVLNSETKEPLPGANVLIIQQVISEKDTVPLDISLGAATDVNGYYFILNVPPGVFNIKASLIGFSSLIQTGVKVDLDRTIQINFELSTTALQIDEVVITAKRELIKKDVSGTQEIIVTTRLDQAPVLRVDEFVGTLKGVEVQSGAQGHGLSVRGGAIRETDIRLDGISLQDPRTENSYLAFNSTSIKEIQVLTGGFQAKYGNIRSGLMNVVTKEGQRDRYTFSAKVDIAPSNQNRFFGTSLWSQDSWIYKVYAGEYAFQGIKTHEDSINVPSDFHQFKGWSFRYQTLELGPLDSLQRLELWKQQHPTALIADKPDYYIEGSITGPFPGDFIPFFGDFAERTTFLLGFKYEDSQLSYPIGPRRNYVDWNGQIKLTTILQSNMKLSVNAFYSKIETVSGGRTTSYGGALVDQASSFNFLNTAKSSVVQSAGLIGGGSYNQIYNLSRLQFYDQRYIVGGAKFTHSVSSNAFYDIEFQMGFTDQDLQPFAMDTSVASNYAYFYSTKTKKTYRYYIPTYGTPNASTNYGNDALGTYVMYGGPQRIDSSYSYVYQLSGDFTAQFGRHHQFETGFSARLQDLFVYTGTWFQSELSFTPDTWQYYNATPLEIGLYVQDKLEFEGMILNAGLRLDILNPMKKSYEVSHPLDEDYQKLYDEIYPELPGDDPKGYERWIAFRSLLDNPPGWPETENKIQTCLSPRLGVSFPITESSKLYFNYGHFYQRPPIAFMYNLNVVSGGVQVPTPSLKMAQTISYEFGYEQMFFDDFIVNVTAYYKDVKGEPLSRTYVDYYQYNVTEYVPDAYKDIRGLELRLERPIGEFVTFNAMYDYMVQSSGQSGLSTVYENKVENQDELRYANLTLTDPRPRANINLNFHTPNDFGPRWLSINWLANIYANFFFEWRDGGSFLFNPTAPVEDQIYFERVDRWNIDFRGSKAFHTSLGILEFVVTIQNLTNNKWLEVGNMTQKQYDEYVKSLNTPNKGGSDKWGQYKSDDGHIKTGWYETPIFLNPRRIILGFRLNI